MDFTSGTFKEEGLPLFPIVDERGWRVFRWVSVPISALDFKFTSQSLIEAFVPDWKESCCCSPIPPSSFLGAWWKVCDYVPIPVIPLKPVRLLCLPVFHPRSLAIVTTQQAWCCCYWCWPEQALLFQTWKYSETFQTNYPFTKCLIQIRFKTGNTTRNTGSLISGGLLIHTVYHFNWSDLETAP